MPECDRCGRSTTDGATVRWFSTVENWFCMVCEAWYEEHGGVRSVDQAGLDEY